MMATNSDRGAQREHTLVRIAIGYTAWAGAAEREARPQCGRVRLGDVKAIIKTVRGGEARDTGISSKSEFDAWIREDAMAGRR